MSLKPNANRSNAAIILIGIVLFVDFISLILGYFQFKLLNTVANGETVSIQDANANDLRVQLVAILFVIVSIISFVTFILWFRRAYFNLHQKVNDVIYEEGWAAGCWFVPFLNLFRPYQIMNELFKKTSLILEQEGKSIQKVSNRIVGIWWVLWILNGIINQVVFNSTLRAGTLDSLIFLTTIDMIGSISGIVLGCITIKMILNYTLMEMHLKDETPTYVISNNKDLLD